MLALHENIRRLRRAAGLSQEELAGRLGVSRQSVSLWEQGETNPTVENIYAMAEVLGVGFDDLMAPPAADEPANATAAKPAATAAETETVTARSFDELMRESAPTPRPLTPPPAAFSNTAPAEAPRAERSTERDRRTEAQYYRYRELMKKTQASCWILLSGGLMMLFALIVLGSLATDQADRVIGGIADTLGPICILTGLCVFVGGLVAAIVYAARAGSQRRRMGETFDLATYEELKRGGQDYAAKRK